ncbi:MULTISPECIES: lmo0937 family membrane protein [unclassified Bacillus (in: firmicutes)]|uniref:lmo0937 family membrane protein n=1 Tax=unclassified Bacillus (in: firmicutes) TaxID=185979 RepID=UPI0027B9D799|nr:MULTISPECIES: lmo0937 family membrane protein [unclassified Bacillus (in: firmicutes)]
MKVKIGQRNNTVIKKGMFIIMWILFFILLILWVLGYFTFHIAGGLIHIVLIIAIIVFIVNLFRRKK